MKEKFNKKCVCFNKQTKQLTKMKTKNKTTMTFDATSRISNIQISGSTSVSQYQSASIIELLYNI